MKLMFVHEFAHYRKQVCHLSEVARSCGAACTRRIQRIRRRLGEARAFGFLIAQHGIAGYNRQPNRPRH
jgi:hypothetical protein